MSRRATPARRHAPLLVTSLVGLVAGCQSTLDPRLRTGDGAERALEAPRALGRDEAIVGVSGSYSYNEDDREDRETFDLRLEGGAYAGAEHEFGGWLLGRYANRERDAESSRDVWLGLHYHYHFALADTTSLFAGPTVGWSIFDTGAAEDDGFGYGAAAGVRHWVSPSAALTFTPTLFCVEGSPDSGGDSRDLVVYWGAVFRL